MKTEIKRVKGVPYTYRLQNILFTEDNQVIWFSATNSILQKIKGYFNGDGTEYANVSTGITVPTHGQEVQPCGFDCVETPKGIFNLTTGVKVDDVPYALGFDWYKPNTLRSYVSNTFLQGAELVGENINTVHGNPSKDDITVLQFDKNSNKLSQKIFKFKDYARWYWGEWEAEGIRTDNFGKLWFGVDVKTIFGLHLTYLVSVE